MLRPLVRVTDTLRLLVLGDDAIALPPAPPGDAGEALHAEHARRAAVLTAYFGGEDLDASKLTLIDGIAPTWFTVRPLTEHEMALCDVEGRENVAHKAYEILRLAVVGIDGWDGWGGERAAWCGTSALTLASVEAIPREAARWLAGVVWKVSSLPAEKKRSSGSSPTPPTGIGPTGNGFSGARTSATSTAGWPDGAGATPIATRGPGG